MPKEESHSLQLWAALIGLFGVVFLYGIVGADADALWYDEIRSVAVVGGAQYGPYNPVDIINIGIINGSLTQLPAYFFVLWLWGALVGWSELALRTLSVLFSLLALAWMYRLGRDLYSQRAGFIAALILAISPFFLYYTHELRPYSFIVLSVTFTVWCYYQLMHRRDPGRWWYIGLFFGIFTVLHTHYFAMPVIGALALYHVLFQRQHWRRPILPALAAGSIALLWIPIFLIGFNHIEGDVELHGRAISFLESITQVVHYFSNGHPLLLVILLGVVLWVGWRAKAFRYILWMVTASMLLMAVLNQVTHVLTTSRIRYLIAMWPLLAALLGIGLAKLSHRRYGTISSGGLLIIWGMVAVISSTDPALLEPLNPDPFPRWRTLTNVIKAQSQPDDIFVFHSGELADDAWFALDHAAAGMGIPSFISLALYDRTSPDNQAWAQEQVDTAQRIWYGVDSGIESTSWRFDFEALLADSFVNCGLFAEDERLSLELYARSQAHCPGGEPTATFGDGITLTGLERIQSADALTVYVGFDVTDDVPLQTYSVAVQALDADGQLAAQNNIGLPAGSFTSITLNMPLQDVSAGDYEVYLIVYDWQSGERLPAAYLIDSTPSDSLQLESLTIEQ